MASKFLCFAMNSRVQETFFASVLLDCIQLQYVCLHCLHHLQKRLILFFFNHALFIRWSQREICCRSFVYISEVSSKRPKFNLNTSAVCCRLLGNVPRTAKLQYKCRGKSPVVVSELNWDLITFPVVVSRKRNENLEAW